MAVLDADVHIPHKGTPTKMAMPCAGADIFYAGALLYADAADGLVQALPAAGDVFAGICAKQVTTTAANDLVEVYVDGIHALAYASAAEGDQMDHIVIVALGTLSDNEADAQVVLTGALAGNDIRIGKMRGMNQQDTSRAWIELHPGEVWSLTLGWV